MSCSTTENKAPPLGCAPGASSPRTTGPATSPDWLRRVPPWRFGRLIPCFLHCQHLSLQTRMALKHHAAPQFFRISDPPRKGAPGPRAPAAGRFAIPPRIGETSVSESPSLGFEHDFGRIAASLSNRCRPAPERGRGGFRMGRTQPHGIDEPHGTAPAPIFGVRPAYCQESELACCIWLNDVRARPRKASPRRASSSSSPFGRVCRADHASKNHPREASDTSLD